MKRQYQFKKLFTIILAALMIASLAAPAGPAYAASKKTSSTASKSAGKKSSGSASKSTGKSGWMKSKSGKRYYKKGYYLTGLQKIGKKYYYFNSKGYQQNGIVTASGVTYYIDKAGVLKGLKQGSKYYYPNGVKMTKADVYDFKAWIHALELVEKLTTNNMSKAKKLDVCFHWAMKMPYQTRRKMDLSSNWPALNADDFFVRGSGDCHAFGASVAYMASAIGYTDVYTCNDSHNPNGHGWAEVNGKVYDALFARTKGAHKGMSYSYNVSYSRYGLSPVIHIKTPQFSPSHAKKSGKTSSKSFKQGLNKSATGYYYYENGKRLKSCWKQVGNARYYFLSSGKAATGPVKIKGTWYVFSSKGKLLTGSQTANHKLGSTVYRVTKSGKAVSGWKSIDGKKYRFSKKGARYQGANLIGGKLFLFSDSGVYQKGKTEKLQAAVKAKDLEAIGKILGSPKKKDYLASCDGRPGDDGIWYYKGFNIYTYRDPDGTETLNRIATAK